MHEATQFLIMQSDLHTKILCISKGRDHILEKAKQISRIQREVGMQADSEYEETFKFGLMEVVFEWARGIVSWILT